MNCKVREENAKHLIFPKKGLNFRTINCLLQIESDVLR